MIRRLLRGLRHLLGAVVLLCGLVCLAEVYLSARRAELRVADSTDTAPELVVPSRLYFEELKPLSLSRSGDDVRSAAVRTNSFGLRGPEPQVPKPRGRYRVLLLGDEATLAGGTPEAETFTHLTQRLLTGRTALPVEVINGGLPGGCPLTLDLLYRHRLTALGVDAVVLMLHESDVADDLRRRPYVRTDDAGRTLACPHPTLGGRAGRLEVWRDELRLVDLAARHVVGGWVDHSAPVRDDLLSGHRSREWLTDPGGMWAEPLAMTLSPVRRLKSDADAAGIQLAAMIVPTPADGGGVTGPATSAGWAEVTRMLASIGVPTIDATADLAKSDPRELFTNQGQLAARGHQQVALKLAVTLSQWPRLAK